MTAKSAVLMHAEAQAEQAEGHHRRHGTEMTARLWAQAIQRAAKLRSKAGAR